MTDIKAAEQAVAKAWAHLITFDDECGQRAKRSAAIRAHIAAEKALAALTGGSR